MNNSTVTTSGIVIGFNLSSIKPVTQTVYLKNDFFLFCFPGSLDYEYISLYQTFTCFVNPVLAMFGQAMNLLCMAILARSGLRKTANILLFALALGDSMNMLIDLDFGGILMYFGPDKTKPGYCTWEYEARLNMFLYVSKQICTFVGSWGHTINAVIPIIITLERLLAVYFPVTFKKVVTTKSILISCFVAYTFWLPWHVFTLFTSRLLYFRVSKDRYISAEFATELLDKNYDIIVTFINYVMESLCSWLPLFLVTIGCILIGVKIKLTMMKRRRLSSMPKKQQWSPQTTLTLMVSCLVFDLAHAVNTLIGLTLNIQYYSPVVTYFLVSISEFINILQCSSNFLVYIATNRKLWTVFLELMQTKKQGRQMK